MGARASIVRSSVEKEHSRGGLVSIGLALYGLESGWGREPGLGAGSGIAQPMSWRDCSATPTRPSRTNCDRPLTGRYRVLYGFREVIEA